MAIKFPDFLKNLTGTGTKSRVFILIGAIAGIALAIFIVSRYLEGGASTTGPSKVATAPSGLQTVPGSQMSPEFYRAVMQANVQAAQQAQISGGSAVPTLVNIPGIAEQHGCCDPNDCNTSDKVSNLTKTGKLTQQEADKYLELVKNNVSIDEFTGMLNDSVRDGKLTPDQARDLLACYTKQYKNRLSMESATGMDTLIKSGKLPLDVANRLMALQKSGLSAAEYAEELNRLVKEGKISPEMAAQLLAQYTQQLGQEQNKAASYQLKAMAKAGQISPDAAASLDALQQRNASVDDYEKELNRLVAAGKMTPEMAAKLLAKYKEQHAQPISAALADAVSKGEATELSAIDALLKSGKITPETASLLQDIFKKSLSGQQCQQSLQQLVQQKKLQPDDQAKLAQRCTKLADLRKEVKQLAAMQARKSTLAEYLEALKRLVKLGLISPETAAALMQDYQNLQAAQTGAVGPPPAAGVPGSEEFAKLQERLQAQQPGGVTAPPVGAAEFQAPTEPQQGVDLEAARRQRIETIMNTMSGQATQLISAWQPPIMTHVAGAPEEKEPSKALEKAKENGGESSGSKSESSESGGIPLIKSGTILFAVLDTGANSDYPDTPVLATIVMGQYKGAKLLGKLQVSSGKDKMSLTFNLMNMDAWPRSKTINAFAIDPDTARTALASSVDNHYFKRYGGLFASSFLSGYAQAIMQSGSQTTISTTGTTTTTPPLSPTNKLAVGLGKVGEALSASMQENLNIPPTVVVNAGVGLGILFMSDVT